VSSKCAFFESATAVRPLRGISLRGISLRGISLRGSPSHAERECDGGGVGCLRGHPASAHAAAAITQSFVMCVTR
jgi:hypothetical protein